MPEPITTAELKAHLRIAHDDQDDYLDTLIAAAREELELLTWRGLVLTERTITLRGFPNGSRGWRAATGDEKIYLPFPPLQEVTSIEYLDANGDEQTLDESLYVVDSAHLPGTIEPAYGQAWPATRDHPAAVVITCDAGYEDADAVPALCKHAIKLIAAQLYEHAEPAPLSPSSGGTGLAPTTLDRLVEKLIVRHPGILDCV